MYDSALHFAATYAAFTPEFAFSAETREELAQWHAEFRPRLRQILGLAFRAEIFRVGRCLASLGPGVIA